MIKSKKPKRPQRQRQQNNRLKPLTLAYDGDADIAVRTLSRWRLTVIMAFHALPKPQGGRG
ncbi:hypothetical protein CRUP_028476 [Coryphaenoides rupestris]|nr:hypothetical protein CRUP_028476 [Coryphaenoides rupestris]